MGEGLAMGFYAFSNWAACALMRHPNARIVEDYWRCPDCGTSWRVK